MVRCRGVLHQQLPRGGQQVPPTGTWGGRGGDGGINKNVVGPLLAARVLPLRCAASTVLGSALLAIWLGYFFYSSPQKQVDIQKYIVFKSTLFPLLKIQCFVAVCPKSKGSRMCSPSSLRSFRLKLEQVLCRRLWEE
jgi:hypothetical protein